MQVEFIQEPSEKGDAFCIYTALVSEDDGEKKKFLIADLRRMGGGMTLRDWQVTERQGRRALALYLEVSIMGHDLDQWVYHDLETGEKLE